MLSIEQERFTPTKGRDVCALTFTANGDCLVTGGNQGFEVWQVKDEKQAARMEMLSGVFSLAASKNGKWIAAGTYKELLV